MALGMLLMAPSTLSFVEATHMLVVHLRLARSLSGGRCILAGASRGFPRSHVIVRTGACCPSVFISRGRAFAHYPSGVLVGFEDVRVSVDVNGLLWHFIAFLEKP